MGRQGADHRLVEDHPSASRDSRMAPSAQPIGRRNLHDHLAECVGRVTHPGPLIRHGIDCVGLAKDGIRQRSSKTWDVVVTTSTPARMIAESTEINIWSRRRLEISWS